MTNAPEQDVVDLLLTQHNEIKTLFGRLSEAAGDQKRELFEDLVRMLAVHESAEEELVHPLARTKIRSGDSVVDRRLSEEQEAKQVLSDLYDLGTDHPEFDTKLAALREAVLDHATHEEREEFPELRRTVSTERLTELAGAVRAAEAMAPTRPHPGV